MVHACWFENIAITLAQAAQQFRSLPSVYLFSDYFEPRRFYGGRILLLFGGVGGGRMSEWS
jgi:hypothetical protein